MAWLNVQDWVRMQKSSSDRFQHTLYSKEIDKMRILLIK